MREGFRHMVEELVELEHRHFQELVRAAQASNPHVMDDVAVRRRRGRQWIGTGTPKR